MGRGARSLSILHRGPNKMRKRPLSFFFPIMVTAYNIIYTWLTHTLLFFFVSRSNSGYRNKTLIGGILVGAPLFYWATSLKRDPSIT